MTLTQQIEIQTAETIAILAHFGQKTKSEGMDYVRHPGEVARQVPVEFKAAAWLHDVLEDSSFTETHLLACGISRQTVEIVKIVSRRIDSVHQVNLETYDEFIRRIARSGSLGAILVKLADLKHNLRPSCPPELAGRYNRAVPILRVALDELPNPPLEEWALRAARRILTEYKHVSPHWKGNSEVNIATDISRFAREAGLSEQNDQPPSHD